MKAPATICVLDQHKGFTAITREKAYERDGLEWKRVTRESGTLWRPGSLLRNGTIGTLQESDEQSFYQTNNNVTKAIYKVPGYAYRVAVWFDNETGKRIA